MIKVFDIDPGTTVWFMHNNKPTSGVVDKVWSNTFVCPFDSEKIEESEWYYITIGKTQCSFRKNELFPSKEELKKSL